MYIILQLLAGLLLLLASVSDAIGQRRPIRVDGFGSGAWIVHETPTPICFGWSDGSTLLLGPGYVFSGRDDPAHLTDTYCQKPAPGRLTQTEFFYADETALAAMIGPNVGDRITATRYALLDAQRNDDPTGFQWIFYYFTQGGTIVGLYGLEQTVLDGSTYISYNGTRLFDAARDGFTGQYFCIEGLRWMGTWDGQADSVSPCQLIGYRVYRGDFE
jgi:hypothetical protein